LYATKKNVAGVNLSRNGSLLASANALSYARAQAPDVLATRLAEPLPLLRGGRVSLRVAFPFLGCSAVDGLECLGDRLAVLVSRGLQILVRRCLPCGGRCKPSVGGRCQHRAMAHEGTILHADADSFYASGELRDDPGLRGRR
jgi:hypothetical protein